MDQTTLTQIAMELSRAKRILVITGAGISADSGLPTYRGIGGLYTNGFVEEDVPIEEALSGNMLHENPALVWKYIQQIEQACRHKSCNAAHQIIAQWDAMFESVWILTQNVDGYHQSAGSSRVIEIHGNLHRLRCTHCAYQERVDDYCHLAIPPRCPECQSLVRPAVVLFGEMLPQREVLLLTAQLQIGFDLIFTIGTTSVFPYIAGPVEQAVPHHIPTIEINPEDTEVSHLVTHKIRLGAADALQRIHAQFAGR